LAAALVKAQAEVENATKNAANPFYRSRYADLTEILRVTKPVFATHGLAVVQFVATGADGTASLENVILHESGEWMAETASAPLAPKETKEGPKPSDAQSLGSAITYLRRYSLAAIAGITQEDDDGNAASHPPKAEASARQDVPAKSAPTDAGDMIPCPKCGGGMYDNRVGKKNPKGPDLKCKDKSCDHAIWLDGWRKDLLKEIEAAHTVEAIDAHERERAETAVATMVPAKLDGVQKWLADLAQNAGA
jgi:hypothetical protein